MNKDQIRQEAEKRFPITGDMDTITVYASHSRINGFEIGAEWALSQKGDYERLREAFEELLDLHILSSIRESDTDGKAFINNLWRYKAGINPPKE